MTSDKTQKCGIELGIILKFTHTYTHTRVRARSPTHTNAKSTSICLCIYDGFIAMSEWRPMNCSQFTSKALKDMMRIHLI